MPEMQPLLQPNMQEPREASSASVQILRLCGDISVDGFGEDIVGDGEGGEGVWVCGALNEVMNWRLQ